MDKQFERYIADSHDLIKDLPLWDLYIDLADSEIDHVAETGGNILDSGKIASRHTQRLAAWSYAAAYETGQPVEIAAAQHMAALMHDVFKKEQSCMELIASDRFLTASEREIVDRHPHQAYDEIVSRRHAMLESKIPLAIRPEVASSRVRLMYAVGLLVLRHHEHYADPTRNDDFIFSRFKPEDIAFDSHYGSILTWGDYMDAISHIALSPADDNTGERAYGAARARATGELIIPGETPRDRALRLAAQNLQPDSYGLGVEGMRLIYDKHGDWIEAYPDAA